MRWQATEQIATIPMRLIGPLKLIGPEVEAEVMVPLATFETPLWPSTHRGAGRRTVGVRAELRSFPDRNRAFRFILDLALGTYRTGAGDTSDRLPGRARAPRRSSAIYRCAAWQSASVNAAPANVPAHARG